MKDLDEDMNDLWVFGYGSLLWQPGFNYQEVCRAHLFGYRRSLCIHSYVHRGTESRPGLVLGLDRGGSCIGLAFRVADSERNVVTDYLRNRELVTNVYLERRLPVKLDGGKTVVALTYIVDRNHRQYAGSLEADDAACHVRVATGRSGPNDAYVRNTVSHLRQLGIYDHRLEDVLHKLA